MNLPTKITLSRIILGPLFLISYLNDRTYVSLFFIFINLVGDVLDGFLARKRKEITKFGEFIDPAIDFIFFLFIWLSFSLKGITQFNWFFIPLMFIILSFAFSNLKHGQLIVLHTKFKLFHTVFIYLLISMILLELNFRTFFWITFTIFSLVSLELFLRSLRDYFQRQSFTT